jgi:ferredoxin-type protein NapH
VSQVSLPGRAVENRLFTNRWLILRRFSQMSILALFMVGPLFGIWIVKGNLNSSLVLNTIPLTDPFMLLQIIASGHIPELTALTGSVLVLLFYFLVGGRSYCSWVCPINPLTDAALWLRRKLKYRQGWSPDRSVRIWILGAVVLLAASTGTLVWETINPVSMTHRGLIFGVGLAWMVPIGVFLFDLLVAPRGWCGHICPMGVFYSLVGHYSPLKITAGRKAQCDDCGDCYQVCPEPQVLKPALKGEGPLVASANCTNCARCIEICPRNVFYFTNRFSEPRELQQ